MYKDKNIMNKKLLLSIAVGLVLLGLFKPNFSNIIPARNESTVTILVEEPTNEVTLEACKKVTQVLSSGPNPKKDALDLASLYSDVARLIELDGEDMVIKNTEEIASVNKIAGSLLKLNLKGKYDNLATSCEEVVKSVVGNDNVPLDNDLRKQAVVAFKNLAWACKKGAE
jgi:hypothetical protein